MEDITGGRKYVSFAGGSKVKTDSDISKFEKARQLKSVIHQVRERYKQMMMDSDETNRQLGTATYIIDVLAIRAGNEKGEDKADTVGCCSLRVEHVKLLEDLNVNFNFLGKDSIEYNNTIKVDELVYRNLERF
jgi:DNA topoisomerase-1